MKLFVIMIIALLSVWVIAPNAMSQTVDESRLSGRRANATVSFGLWETDPPLDRFAGNPAMGARNHHEVIPNVSRINISRNDSGGVNFIISGNHVVAIYDDGTRPEDIDPNMLVQAEPPITVGGGIIDDPDKRIYRGANQTAATGARDRVEVVHFSKPGTYLVICAIRNHFVNDGMYGFVVVRDDQIFAQ
ncbi:MAG TPA: hypothetical protein VF353_02185 [Candidatus Binatia bacterium]